MWLKARTLATLEGRLPETVHLEVAFKTPVLLPSTVASRAEQDGDAFTLDVRNAKTASRTWPGRSGPDQSGLSSQARTAVRVAAVCRRRERPRRR